ncbi:MAG TPA: hypothetical protein VFM46_11245, partial [Pseudomonadales bacterium]|nr:hypothetical protein [Pseudomonadales bacterium]
GVESTLVYRPKDGMLYATYDGATGSRLLLKKGVDGIPGPLILGGVAVTEPSIETIRSMICTE